MFFIYIYFNYSKINNKKIFAWKWPIIHKLLTKLNKIALISMKLWKKLNNVLMNIYMMYVNKYQFKNKKFNAQNNNNNKKQQEYFLKLSQSNIQLNKIQILIFLSMDNLNAEVKCLWCIVHLVIHYSKVHRRPL